MCLLVLQKSEKRKGQKVNEQWLAVVILLTCYVDDEHTAESAMLFFCFIFVFALVCLKEYCLFCGIENFH